MRGDEVDIERAGEAAPEPQVDEVDDSLVEKDIGPKVRAAKRRREKQ